MSQYVPVCPSVKRQRRGQAAAGAGGRRLHVKDVQMEKQDVSPDVQQLWSFSSEICRKSFHLFFIISSFRQKESD